MGVERRYTFKAANIYYIPISPSLPPPHYKNTSESPGRDWITYFEKPLQIDAYQCFNLIFHLHLHEKWASLRQNYMFKYTDAAHKASHGCSTET